MNMTSNKTMALKKAAEHILKTSDEPLFAKEIAEKRLVQKLLRYNRHRKRQR
jgi:hypothetical protein